MQRNLWRSFFLAVPAGSFAQCTQTYLLCHEHGTKFEPVTTMASSIPLFEEVVSRDVLGFSFGGRSYADQITDAVAKTKVLCAVKVERKTIGKVGSSETAEVVWVTHNFGFLGAWSPRISALL